jgi:putative phosphoribosyl transferase
VDHHHPPFKDRRDAGRQLAAALLYLKEADPIVLALPRGGVPVGYEIAAALHAPLDVLIVRKIGAPYHRELGLGAVAGGIQTERVINQNAIECVKPSDSYLEAETQRQIEEIERYRQLYRGDKAPPELGGRTVIVVDDGVATGGSIKAALKSLEHSGAKKLLFAVPVASNEALASLCDYADDGMCLLSPPMFRAVSLYYDDFRQTTEEEVIALLQQSAREQETCASKPEAGK